MRRRLLLLLAGFVLQASLVACNSGENENLRAENDEFHTESVELTGRVEELEAALRKANLVIREASSEISYAQILAFGDCESLRLAVQMISDPDEVSVP